MSLRLAAILLLAATVPGCARYERVVHYKPALANLPGAQSGMPVVIDPKRMPTSSADTEQRIRIERDDGEIELISRSAFHMLSHIHATLSADEEELFTEYVLSNRTKQEFIDRGWEPKEAFVELKRRERDVYALLARMPMGEYTPGLFLERLERNTFRLHVGNRGTENLAWKFVDIVVEQGQWRLRWFGA